MRDLATRTVMITGAGGFVGRRVADVVRKRGCCDLLTPSRMQCDLLDAVQTQKYVSTHAPDVVIHIAAATGGVAWNAMHAFEAFRDNTLMTLHLIDAMRTRGCGHVTHVSTSIAYPSDTPVPWFEDTLWNGRPGGPTAGYAHAKRMGEVMLELAASRSDLTSAVVMPANTYGSGARMDSDRANVVAGMVRRFVEAAFDNAEEVTCWGSGRAQREFIHVDDVAEGIVRATERLDTPEPVNLGTGRMVSIEDLAKMVAKAADWKGRVCWDATRPDGVPAVCCDISRMKALLAWSPETELEAGVEEMVHWYRQECGHTS